jgi:hypothetical protein
MIGVGSHKTGAVAITNRAAGNYTDELGFTQYDHFNIFVDTLTDAAITIEGTLDNVHWKDITDDLFGVSALVAGEYLADTVMTYLNLRLSVTHATGVNATNYQWMVKKSGGR